MNNEINVNVNGENFRQVQKRTAKKMFLQGIDIFAIPCKANPNSILCSFLCQLNSFKNSGVDLNKIWEHYNNEFIYYNCNSKMGLYPHYYIKMS